MLRKGLVTFILGSLLALSAHATHISGGEIYYDCLGGNQYRITLVVYRDCAGINLNTSYDLSIVSPCGSKTVTVSTPGGAEISQLCHMQLPNSTCNGGGLPGIQQYIYTGIVTLPPCNSWTISWTEPWRNGAIVNLVQPGNKNVYIQAVMNNVAGPCEHSPRFTNTAIPYVCAGFPISYSYGAYDTEGDSLTYTFISAMNTGAVPLPYQPGFSGTQPITGITLNPNTGQVNFTLNTTGNWVVVVRVDEYDSNGIWIGSVMRDMQFIAYPCTNVPPDPTTGLVANLSGTATQTGPRAVEICESGNFCFDAVISDPNAGDTLRATSNITQNLPGATFSYTGINPITVHVCWNGVANSSGFFPFIISVSDGACPIPAIQTYVYSVSVLAGISLSGTTTDETCAGTGNGTATASVTVGSPPYQYAWNTGATTPGITAAAGIYHVVVTDAEGCVSHPLDLTIAADGQPNVAHAGTDLIGCFTSLPVQLHGTVTNATGGSWSGGAGSFTGVGLNVSYMPTPAEIAANAVDLYLATTGNTACPPGLDTIHVTLPTNFFGSRITSTGAPCQISANGTATYLPAVDGLSVLWNDPAAQTTMTASGLLPGNYTVHVSDGYGCDTTLSTTVTAPVAITLSSLDVINQPCAGNGNGSITAHPSGGTAPYHFAWSNGDTTALIFVAAGTYTVSVTDAHGCTPATGSATVIAVGQPNAAHAGPDLVGCFSSLPVHLQGSVTNAPGGVWSGGSGSFNGVGLSPTYTPTTSEVQSGGVNLILTTTGNTTCPPNSDTIHVTLPTSFFGSSISHVDAACNATSTGSAAFLPNDPAFSFLWNDPATQTTATATGLHSGNYAVHVTDALGCDTTLNTAIAAPAAISITGLNVVPEQCAGNHDGSVTATASGGTMPYRYLWSNGDTTAWITVGAGTYSLSVTDANGCAPATGSAIVPVLGQPNAANAGADMVGCFSSLPVHLQGAVTNATGGTWAGGSGTFTGTGLTVSYMPTAAEIAAHGVNLLLTTTGNTTCATASDSIHITLPTSFFGSSISPMDAACNATSTGSAAFLPNDPAFSFLWNDPATQTTATATGLHSGNYAVHVTDALGCDTTLNTAIAAPAAISITGLNVVPEQCAGNHDGSITATASGGTLPYHYLWSNGDTTASITVGAGTYSLSVTDANGCAPATGSAIVNVLGQPNAANAGADMVGCFSSLPVHLQGAVTNATGGTWAGGSGTFTGTGLTVSYMPTAAEIAAHGVNLLLTTTGNTTCATASDSIHITLPTSFFGAVSGSQAVACSGDPSGSAQFLPNDPAFTYLWNDPSAQTSHQATGLLAGNYALHVTDSYGCDTTVAYTITQPPPLAISASIGNNPTCAGGTNGSAAVTINGGTPSYSYQWSANSGSQTAATATSLPQGAYTVTVSDAHGCHQQSTVVLTSPPGMTLAAQVPDTVCVNALVELTAQAAGGSGGYSILWSGIGNGDTLQYSFPASQLVHVSVTDQAGCSGPGSDLPVTVLNLSQAVLHTYGDTTFCAGGTATVGAHVSGYPGSTSLNWPQLSSTGNGPFHLTAQSTTTLDVMVTDVCSNTLHGTVTIHVETPPAITLPPLIAEGCAPLTVHFPSGLTDQPVTYLWHLGDGTTSNSMAPVHVYPAGDYTVTLTMTTPIGCSADALGTGMVHSYAMPVAAFAADPWQTNMDQPNIQFSDQSTGGPNSWSWSFGDGGSSANNNPGHAYADPGTWNVLLNITDTHGCTSSVAHTVQVDPVYNVTIPNAFSPNPNGGSGGGYDPTDLSNDVFYPFIRYVKDFRMRIFNRWGELVFESNDIRKGWDGYYKGKLSQQDVYAYQIWVRFTDNKEVQRLGDLTLFR